jgi:hypothetical protein
MRPNLTSILAAGCLLAATTVHAVAFPATVVERTEMREGPSGDFDALVELPEGSVVEVLNCDAGWCEAGIEDYDGFIPRRTLSFGSYVPPAFVFPPLIAEPGRWHGRYYSREHFRYESRARWRDREGRRLYVIPPRVQRIPLRPLIRRDGPPGFKKKDGVKDFKKKKGPDGPKEFKKKGPDGLKEFKKGPGPKEFKKGPALKEFKKGPAPKEFKKGPALKEFKKGPAPKEFKKGPAPKEFKKGPPPKKGKKTS